MLWADICQWMLRHGIDKDKYTPVPNVRWHGYFIENEKIRKAKRFVERLRVEGL